MTPLMNEPTETRKAIKSRRYNRNPCFPSNQVPFINNFIESTFPLPLNFLYSNQHDEDHSGSRDMQDEQLRRMKHRNVPPGGSRSAQEINLILTRPSSCHKATV